MDSPREKLRQQSAQALSDAELLAIILRSELPDAVQLLAEKNGLHGLAKVPFVQLANDLGAARAAQMLAAFELGKRLFSRNGEERPLIRTSEDAAHFVAPDMENLPQEHLRVILLDVTRRVMAIATVYIGSLNMTVVRTAEVFREAVTQNAASLILVHNHPSGDPTPSDEDIALTEHLAEAGRLLDIAVLDHLIIGQGKWVSLRDTGFLT